jgi:hypothetical protein
MTNALSLQDSGLRRMKKFALIALSAAVSTTGRALHQIHVSALLAGQEPIAAFPCASKLVCIMGIAPIQILVLVSVVGRVMIAQFLFVHKIVCTENA